MASSRELKREDPVKWFAVILFAMLATVAPSAHDEAAIPEQLRESGSFERVIISSYEPLQLADLAGRADVIVEASTRGGKSFLSATGSDIFTDYLFEVHTVIKNSENPQLRVGNDTDAGRIRCKRNEPDPVTAPHEMIGT